MVFEFLHILPSEFQTVDEMKTENRLSSNNTIWGLKFDDSITDEIFIQISLEKDSSSFDINLIFEKQSLKCKNESGETLWESELNSSLDLIEFAKDHFKNLLRTYQNDVDHLVMEGPMFSGESEGFNLINLGHLKVHGIVDAMHFLPKIQEKLNVLIVEGKDTQDLANFKQVYQVQKRLELPYTKFTHKQFLRISAAHAHINIGDLTAHQISNFIKSWQHQTYTGKIRSIYWNLEASNFDKGLLFRNFGKQNLREDYDMVYIKNMDDSVEDAVLYYENQKILFAIEYVWKRRNGSEEGDQSDSEEKDDEVETITIEDSDDEDVICLN